MAKFEDLTNKKFGNLTVLRRVENSKHGKTQWLCQCSCGNLTKVVGSFLRNGRTKSCGCLKKVMHSSTVNIGDVYSRLTVSEEVGKDKHGNKLWKCICSCGKITVVTSNNLTKGHTKSCGCLQTELRKINTRTHGKTGTPLHSIWKSMKQRCYDKHGKYYKDYGGRGIKVCKEWKNNYEIFYQWAINNGYEKGLTIDRINNNGNYEPSNCRWATLIEQGNNKRNNILLTYKGKTHTATEWSRITGINARTIRQRVRKGWSDKRTLTTFNNKNKKY